MTRRICPTVEESVSAVKAPVPFPWRRPVRVEAPVPPFPTVRSVLRESAPIVTVPRVAVWEKRLVLEAVVEKKLVEVALVVVALVARSPVAKREVVVEKVELAFTVTRLVMVEEAEFTSMPSPAVSGER